MTMIGVGSVLQYHQQKGRGQKRKIQHQLPRVPLQQAMGNPLEKAKEKAKLEEKRPAHVLNVEDHISRETAQTRTRAKAKVIKVRGKVKERTAGPILIPEWSGKDSIQVLIPLLGTRGIQDPKAKEHQKEARMDGQEWSNHYNFLRWVMFHRCPIGMAKASMIKAMKTNGVQVITWGILCA